MDKGPAGQLYVGSLFSMGMQYAKEQKLTVYILSAKYGFIRPDDVIETYNEKRTKVYDGQWPAGDGLYLGGTLYFGKAPSAYTTLTPGCATIGQMVARVGKLLTDKPAPTSRPTMTRGKTYRLFQYLLEGPITKEEAYRRLCEEFGENEGTRVTINCQFTQRRVGVERNCTLHCENGLYWATLNA